MAPLTLGYWDIRGIAEPIRFLLHYKKVEFNDKRYAFKLGEWKKDKFNLGLDFPNLPYLLDGDVKITQSTTILRYLAKKYQLDGKTAEEKLKVSLVEQQIIDLRSMMFRCGFFEFDLQKARADLAKVAPEQLKLIVKFLGDREFLVGDGVTFVDFLFSETFDFYRYFIPEVCKDFPILKAHQERVVGLPELQEYLNSSTYVRWPIFGIIAKFGGGVNLLFVAVIYKMAPLTLGYWNIRGMCKPIRFLLHYKNVEFIDKRYDFQTEDWKEDKFNLGLDFPNLPYLLDGEVKLTQSTTILRYLAEKYHLDGQTPQEKLKVSLVEQQIIDMRWLIGIGCYFEPDLEKARADLSPKASDHLKLIKKFLGDRNFLVGDSITYVDFLFSEVFDFFRYFVPDVCRDFSTLKRKHR